VSEAAIQLLFRAVNEQIMRVHSAFDVDVPVVDVLCECGDVACTERVALAPEEYERIRDAGKFLVLPEHLGAETIANVA
jgi:hypothetical protein